MATALVTGASSGLGLCLCRELLERGYRVGMLARDGERLTREAAALRRLGEVLPLATDVTDERQLRSSVARVESEWGTTDLAIANAGIRHVTRVGDFSLTQAEHLMRTNYFGMLHLFDAVVPGMMRRRRGAFVGVASLAGWRSLPGGSAYAASKAAMQVFLDTVRIELRPYQVQVVTVNPWFVRTSSSEAAARRPLMVEADWAARRILRGIEGGRTQIDFPLLPALVWKVVRLLPNAWFARLFAPRQT